MRSWRVFAWNRSVSNPSPGPIYGSLAAVIIFLVWLWISNIAILLGAEFDAELQRGRAIEAGHDPQDEPYMDLRDTKKVKPGGDSGL